MSVQSLCGEWLLVCDPENAGRNERWFKAVRADAQPAPVPGVIQQVFPGYHGVAWYWVTFTPARPPSAIERALLRFRAVDYLAEVWLNGQPVGGHEGGETPFTIDVTRELRPGKRNLVAVRVLNPTDDPIDGLRLIETPHSQKGNSGCGACFNPGGIVQSVDFAVVPAVRVVDVFARPNIRSGEVRLNVSVQNDSGRPAHGALALVVEPDKAGEEVARAVVEASFDERQTTCDVPLVVPQPRLWDTDDPHLYRARVSLTAATSDGTAMRHERSIRFGFRELRVKDGYFFLNGRRIFLRSMHTCAAVPVGQSSPDLDLLRRDMVYSRACGFNCVRFLSGMPLPEQLDVADEIGIMVYEENLAAWWSVTEEQATDGEKVRQRFTNALREMVLRDRNHPSVTIWGLLNEARDTLIFRQAASSLPVLRSLDDTRLVLLGSGRWDSAYEIGSVSNPRSTGWEPVWGAEGPEAPPAASRSFKDLGGYLEGAGDAHVYPQTPLTRTNRDFIRHLGDKTKPVFISEGGIGSLLNVVSALRKYDEREGERLNLEDRVFFRTIFDRLVKAWSRLKMDDAHPFPEDLLRDSQRVSLNQRRLWFDLVRSNPNLCGHSLTSMLDFTSGEGFWDCWREFKPGIAEVLRDGWAPLRWCLFVDPLHGYSGRPIRVEAVLANEDVLKPGKYPVTFRIWGRQGAVWEKKVRMTLPAHGRGGLAPLAVPALSETLRLNVPAGDYTFAACLERGGAPSGDRLQFHVSETATLPRLKGAVTVWGIEPRVSRWLRRHGVAARPFRRGDKPAREVILVGHPRVASFEDWCDILRRTSRGAFTLFMSPELGSSEWLPLARKGRCAPCHDWLYHKEVVAKAHPVFDGLPAPGVLDWNYYDTVAGRHLLMDADDPDEVIAAGFAIGLTNFPGTGPTYAASGVMIGQYRFDNGRFLVNTLGIIPNVDRHPAADRLLLNIVRYAQANARKPSARLSAQFKARLAEKSPLRVENLRGM